MDLLSQLGRKADVQAAPLVTNVDLRFTQANTTQTVSPTMVNNTCDPQTQAAQQFRQGGAFKKLMKVPAAFGLSNWKGKNQKLA